MQTGTLFLKSSNEDNEARYKKYRLTLLLLCIGYFIDFYDLTIFSASYVNIIKDLFHIYEIGKIQQFFLLISNFYTAGIFLGGIFFGVLSDKFGRTLMIRYSIVLYSVTTIACIFTHSLVIFILLRFLAGAGLASEFANSSVVISEVLPPKLATRFTSILYFCGILGGMSAVYLSSISWQLMFLFGGISGLVIYIIRKKIVESDIFLEMPEDVKKGDLRELFGSWHNLIKLLKLFLLILPFFF